MVQEVDILRAFQKHCDDRHTHFPRKFGPPLFKHAKAFLVWAQKNDLSDPLGYLTYWFRVVDHQGHKPEIFRLRSNKLLALWKEWQEGEHLDDKRYTQLKQRAGTSTQQQVKALRILTRGHEALKANYWHRTLYELCLAEIDLTGGFHPESSYCTYCPVNVRCAAKLSQVYGFDVVSLRAGRLYDLPPEIAAAAVS